MNELDELLAWAEEHTRLRRRAIQIELAAKHPAPLFTGLRQQLENEEQCPQTHQPARQSLASQD